MEVAAANAKLSLRNDYSEGAHPRLLQALAVASAEINRGYGLDVHSERAAALIRDRLARDADVHFLAGGTQTNLVALAAFLRPHEAVIAPASGHIATHETGAIEASGHKVLTVATAAGKLSPELILPCLDGHRSEHMVKPRLVYISNTTEWGTVYSAAELQALGGFCRDHGLLLYVDGARLASALTTEGNDVDLALLAGQADVRLSNLLIAMRMDESEGGMSRLELRLSNWVGTTAGGTEQAFGAQADLKLGTVLAFVAGATNAGGFLAVHVGPEQHAEVAQRPLGSPPPGRPAHRCPCTPLPPPIAGPHPGCHCPPRSNGS